MKETSDSNVNEIRLLHMRLENDKKILKSIMNSVSFALLYINNY